MHGVRTQKRLTTWGTSLVSSLKLSFKGAKKSFNKNSEFKQYIVDASIKLNSNDNFITSDVQIINAGSKKVSSNRRRLEISSSPHATAQFTMKISPCFLNHSLMPRLII